MIQRCNNPNYDRYHDYGGRGIRVCKRWQGEHGFENFLKDMGHRPQGLTLDRKHNDGNYTPTNCRWATRREQQNNMRPRKRKGLGSVRGIIYRARLKSKPWQAIARIGDVYEHVGYFPSEELAIEARDAVEAKK